MNLSTRFLHLCGVSLITVVAVSCTQAESGPASPSSLSGGPSAVALGPGAFYDASGPWRFVITDVHGNVEDTFDTDVSQDGKGNLSFLDEDDALITLERLGTGVIITYRQSMIAEGEPCDIRIMGTVRVDTRTDTLTASIRLKELGCSNAREGFKVTGTKL
jgi:hypothetical protein